MEFFREYAVGFFGISVMIMDSAETEIKNIDMKTGITEYLFYTDDGNYLHFEFQITDKKEEILRFLHYDESLMYNKKKNQKQIKIVARRYVESKLHTSNEEQ